MGNLVTPQITKTERLTDPYVTAGDRAYLIGAQDGGFPDLGWHVSGEMGGLWAHPIKLLDGFWLRIDGQPLENAARFISGPFWNAHEYTLPDGLSVERRQFVPDGAAGLVLRYTFRSSVARTLELRWLVRSDLQGVWLSSMDGLSDGYDHAAFDAALGAWVWRDDCNPWYVVAGARGATPRGHASGGALKETARTAGRGVTTALDFALSVPAGGAAELELVIAGAHTGESAARQTFARVRDAAPALWQAKEARYKTLLAHSRLECPDETIGAAWDWVKCNYDWLMREVPEWGRGLGAGVQDYPWWFGCDNSYAQQGALALGQHEVAVETLDLLRALSRARNGERGRVIHECNTRGYAFNPGNTQETPHFVAAVWQTFLWTGDLAFLRRNYDFCQRGVLDWTLGTQCPDGDVLPYGYGIIEEEGLNLQCVDTATHTAEALDALAGMAETLGEGEVAARCRTLRAAVQARLEAAFWLEEEGLYGDILATPAEIAPRLRQWLRRAEERIDHGEGPPEAAAAYQHLLAEAEADPQQDRKRTWLCRNWIVICPLQAGLAPPERAARALERIESPEFSARWGMYLSGIERGQIMSINTGVLAVAELAYGRVEQALHYMRQITETLRLHMPGAISEMSPDGGCFVQAWSGYGVAWPLVTGIFGLRPQAHRRHLTLRPTFPKGWRRAALRGVRIGEASIDLEWDGEALTVTVDRPGWTVSAEGVPLRRAPDSGDA